MPNQGGQEQTSLTGPVVRSQRLRLLALVASLTAILMMTSVISPTTADAAAYTKSVYTPTRLNSTQIRGWADLSRDCSGTYWCGNYIKVERKTWYGSAFQNGWWANANGWNNITANLSKGCHYYRTTIDSYNDVAGSYGGGVNIGPVGFTSNGTKIYRFRTTWSSGWSRHCV